MGREGGKLRDGREGRVNEALDGAGGGAVFVTWGWLLTTGLMVFMERPGKLSDGGIMIS